MYQINLPRWDKKLPKWDITSPKWAKKSLKSPMRAYCVKANIFNILSIGNCFVSLRNPRGVCNVD